MQSQQTEAAAGASEEVAARNGKFVMRSQVVHFATHSFNPHRGTHSRSTMHGIIPPPLPRAFHSAVRAGVARNSRRLSIHPPWALGPKRSDTRVPRRLCPHHYFLRAASRTSVAPVPV